MTDMSGDEVLLSGETRGHVVKGFARRPRWPLVLLAAWVAYVLWSGQFDVLFSSLWIAALLTAPLVIDLVRKMDVYVLVGPRGVTWGALAPHMDSEYEEIGWPNVQSLTIGASQDTRGRAVRLTYQDGRAQRPMVLSLTAYDCDDAQAEAVRRVVAQRMRRT